ncbi:hypothetical protein Esi_0232_0003 [Ectocarpus siliculosus]|uniref:Uncharacterized protein n=1 Tax=Ectocarpus siliculosus TaxID=2880 RepID=D7FSD6_ECTSI|nr:hypothetical protein Esi_0232_0003 [Ectocarpus siliculosus]|eukprot:CBJ31077.1 hypothetical protein Esi_0232_0003 [Ectocarpus siliculosus]
MGAGASAAGMPLQERRDLYEDLKNKYTRSDLDNLAEEEKQAWLEVLDEREAGTAPAAVTAAETTAVAEPVKNGATGEQGVEVEKREADAAACSFNEENLSVSAPEVTVREAAAAAAALTGASSGRKSGWDLSGGGDTGVRPQEKHTRLSYLVGSDSSGDARENGGGGGGDLQAEGGDGAPADDDGGGSRRHSGKRGSAVVPNWRKAAEEVETPNELCVGDIVRVRDKELNGMWFEGVLTAIHDESTFEVELSGDDEDEEGCVQHITVGIDDVVRVMPWFCIEVGDMVECQLEGTMIWLRGTVVNIHLEQALYDVALESCEDGQADGRETYGENDVAGGGGDCEKKQGEASPNTMYRVPESSIRKVVSGRQAAAKRWKKMYLASCVTSAMGRLIGDFQRSS